MQTEDFENCIKVVVVGNGSVGKSSLIRRFCKNTFNPTYKKTIGVDYQERELELPESPIDIINKKKVKFMVWDCAGQEEFDQIAKDYYKVADAVILAYSANDRSSFNMIKGWKSKLETVLNMNEVVAVMLQNKVDLPSIDIQIDPKEAETLAKELKIRFYRVSVKDNFQVDEVFIYLAQAHLKRVYHSSENFQNKETTKVAMFTETSQYHVQEPVNESREQPKEAPVTRRTDGKKEKKCIVQ